MSQTTTPTDAMRGLLASLADELRARNIDAYSETLTRTRCSDLIDQLRLRKLSQQARRPVACDLNNRTAVRKELDRLDQLVGRRSKLRTGDRIVLDRHQDEMYGTGKHDESVGHGGNASYSVQRSISLGADAERLQGSEPSPAQAEYLESLQRKHNQTVSPALDRDQAGDEIDQLAALPDPISKARAKYIRDLQRKLGLPENVPATNAEGSALLDQLIASFNSRKG